MISEPELDGAWESERPAEAAQDDAVPPRGPARPLRWVAVAVVVTSALWAGGLYAFGDRLRPVGPEVRYAVTDNLCEHFKAPALGRATGGFTDATPHKAGRHPAMDWAACSYGSDRPGGSGGFSAVVLVELHKKSDPGPEFALGSYYERIFGDDVPWEEMPGLGEQALVRASEASDGLQLRVRDGGAVFTVELMFFGSPDEEIGPSATPQARPDQDTLTAAAVEDVRALMAALRKG
ncbi:MULTISPECIES: hypothetical protein [Streptomyces]|uniref:DUF3558 domain-containing protein n=1 Tax=Streptomyces amritsarensis TaxID=681158 RepID=A0ABX3G6B6_9ACTN|nr:MULTISPECIES: hypothetical protein [Streptomyces]AQT74188.1 hypothetical protein B1K54_23340 [Streptomyces sp. fd1-xmd]OLZ66063.1 hypothetical protein AVW11_15780 [Streptomyces amritsarensis]